MISLLYQKKKLGFIVSVLMITFLSFNYQPLEVTAATTIPILELPFDGQVFTVGRTFTFDWSPCEDGAGSAINYEIQVSTDPTFVLLEFSEESPISEYYYFTAHKIDDGLYFWRARAEGLIEGWSSWSEIWNFTLAEIPPLPPVLLEPIHEATLNNIKPMFTWEESLRDISNPYAGQYAGSYNIQVSNSSDFTYKYLDNVTIPNSYVSDVALPDGDFWWRVRPIGTLGTIGSWSSTQNFTIDTTSPIGPVLISPSLNEITSDQEITLVWDAVPLVDYYQIQVSNSEHFSPNFYNETTTLTNITLPDLLIDAIYYWKVRAIDEATNIGDWSSIWSFTIDTMAPEIGVVSHFPLEPTERDEITFFCEVWDTGGIDSVTLYYRDVTNSTWLEEVATPYFEDVYTATIGPFESGTSIEYYFSCTDLIGLGTDGPPEIEDVGSYSDVWPYPYTTSTPSPSETEFSFISIFLLLVGVFIVTTVNRISKRKRLRT